MEFDKVKDLQDHAATHQQEKRKRFLVHLEETMNLMWAEAIKMKL